MSNAKRLTALEVGRLTNPGTYGDGRGLMLLVKASGTRSWILRAISNGKRRDFGLGGYPAVSLSKARSNLRSTIGAGSSCASWFCVDT